ncbi:DNA mismatch repair endonuclease MutL [Patescibacteria group bacterium]|nr:DNA mismatch repair endonuclease MutL [Patescibacteria group bacterium]
MSIIKILPENLVNQIAAGEVVERPSSVVKELLENSLDAGADKITLEVNGSGDEMIRITDNGSGMDMEDAKLAFERHATSKISSTDDLFKISSMGFRGEAIASIASVSHVTLQTKMRGANIGTKIVCIGGNIEKIEECGCPEGTQIEVKNLFYNTPVRKKYLKTSSTEYQQILRVFQSMALAYPNVYFSLIHNNQVNFQYPKSLNFLDRIQSVLGKHISENCMPISYESNDIIIEGFIGKPELGRSGNKHQYLFVNQRNVYHHLFSYALAESYGSLLMNGKKPFYAINIRIATDLIDVNVHPQKLEIRFLDQNTIFKILRAHAKVTLEQNSLAPSLKSSNFSNQNYYPIEQQPLQINDVMRQRNVQDALDFTAQIGNANPAKINKYAYSNTSNVDDLSMVPIAQIAKSYILAEWAEGLMIIDQHAAHERILFEQFLKEYKESNIQKQQLLIPQSIELSQNDIAIFENHKDAFTQLGFEIESFGGNTFIIHSIPASISDDNIAEVIMNVLSDIADSKETHATKDSKVRIIEYMSCRTAIKFGKELSMDEMIGLIRQLDKLESPYTCPHGRPSMITLTFDELEKRFKRK